MTNPLPQTNPIPLDRHDLLPAQPMCGERVALNDLVPWVRRAHSTEL